jgi:hypothetical protein
MISKTKAAIGMTSIMLNFKTKIEMGIRIKKIIKIRIRARHPVRKSFPYLLLLYLKLSSFM